MTLKNTLISCICLLLTANSVVLASNQRDARIERIIVAPDHAIIERNASLNLASGQSRWIVEGMPPGLSKDQLDVSITTDNAYVMDWSYKQQDIAEWKNKDEVKRLKDSLKSARKEKKWYEGLLKNLNAEEEMVYANQKIQAGEGIFIEDLEDLATFFRIQLEDILEARLEYEEALENAEEIVNDIESRLEKNRNNWEQGSGQVRALVYSNTRSPARIRIMHQEEAANWEPAYFLHSNIRDGNAVLVHNALINQNTGVDWDNVKIYIRTGRQKDALSSKNRRWELNITDKPANDSESPQSTFMDNFQEEDTRDIEIEERQDIASGQDRVLLPFKEESPDGSYTFKVQPWTTSEAALQFMPDNPDNFPEESGLLRLFHANQLISNIAYDAGTFKEQLPLNFGMTNIVETSRNKELISSDSRSLGRGMVHTYRVTTQLRNNQNTDAELFLEDIIPVSAHEDVSVDIEMESNEGTFNIDSESGKLTGNIILEGRAERQLSYRLIIKHPSGKKIEGF